MAAGLASSEMLLCVLSFILCFRPAEARQIHSRLHGRLESFESVARAYNGSIAVYEKYPYFARLVNTDGYMCSGSIIEHGWVITAAHCLAEIFFKVHVGPGVTSDFDMAQSIESNEAFFLPSNRYGSTERYQYDFALIKLGKHNRKIDGYLSLPLPDQDVGYIDSDRNVTFLGGGGRIKFNGTAVNDTRYLMKLEKASLSLDNCSIQGDFSLTMPFQICLTNFAALEAEGFNICPGDSGGPLVVESNSNANLIALMSAGYRNCTSGFDRSTLTELTRISAQTPYILHFLDLQAHTHEQQKLMDQWMAYPHILSRRFISL